MPQFDPAPCPIRAQPLTQQSFAAFGTVIAVDAQKGCAINAGTVLRFEQGWLDVNDEGGAPCLAIFRGQARSGALRLRCFERHLLGSQRFLN